MNHRANSQFVAYKGHMHGTSNYHTIDLWFSNRFIRDIKSVIVTSSYIHVQLRFQVNLFS